MIRGCQQVAKGIATKYSFFKDPKGDEFKFLNTKPE